jgi:hypothetical protein
LRKFHVIAAAAISMLFLAGSASADDYAYRLTRADQAAARLVVIHRGDLGGGLLWKGGLVAPDRSRPHCAAYNPKQSDLVVTGVAESDWSGGGVHFESSVKVFQSEQMVATDWQRSYNTPLLLPCLRAIAARAFDNANGRLVSVQRLGIPAISTYTEAFRTVADMTMNGKRIRLAIHTIILGRDRTELGLVTVAPFNAETVVTGAEVRLANILADRIPTF